MTSRIIGDEVRLLARTTAGPLVAADGTLTVNVALLALVGETSTVPVAVVNTITEAVGLKPLPFRSIMEFLAALTGAIEVRMTGSDGFGGEKDATVPSPLAATFDRIDPAVLPKTSIP